MRIGKCHVCNRKKTYVHRFPRNTAKARNWAKRMKWEAQFDEQMRQGKILKNMVVCWSHFDQGNYGEDKNGAPFIKFRSKLIPVCFCFNRNTYQIDQRNQNEMEYSDSRAPILSAYSDFDSSDEENANCDDTAPKEGYVLLDINCFRLLANKLGLSLTLK